MAKEEKKPAANQPWLAGNTVPPPSAAKKEEVENVVKLSDTDADNTNVVTESDSKVDDSVVDGEFVEDVIVVVPKAFKLRLDQHRVVDIPAGTQRMERSWVEHWYSKANGVRIFEG